MSEQPMYLAGYRLEAKLGEGGMGIVYRAMDEKLHREVAIKVLHPYLLKHEELKERFRREARMHARLMHPNVVTLLALIEEEGQMALAMEMVHGQNLKEYLRANKQITFRELIRMAVSILDGLQASHQMGMVHRDLKPANVLISDEGQVKLMDFGLAKPERGDDDLTQSGATVGSFRYMAPEQILHQPIDVRTDLYAYGIMLYQMVTGKLPFDASAQGGGEFEIMEKQVREKPKPPQQLRPGISKEFNDLILKLLQKKPADRPDDCQMVKNALLALPDAQSDAVVLTGALTGGGTSFQEITPSVHTASNIDIAKGLLFAAKGHALAYWQRCLAAVESRLPEHVNVDEVKPYITWAAILTFLLLLGWVLVGLLRLAEPSMDVQQQQEAPFTASDVSETSEVQQSEAPSKPVAAPVTPATPVTETPKPVKEAAKVVEAKPVVSTPKPAPKPKPKPRKPRLATETIAYSVTRSDRTDVDPSKPNEFRHGQHVFFYDELESYRFKDTFRTLKSGEIKLIFDQPVDLSKIIIHKASVGRRDFKDGYVKLSLSDEKGHWSRIFTRNDDDIDIPVTLTDKQALKNVKTVQLRFKTPEPITIGPIDLIP